MAMIHAILHRLNRKERVFRARINPLEDYTDEELNQRYRFNRNAINYLVNLFALHLERHTMRNHPLTPLEQMSLALRFYAAGPFQQVELCLLLFHPVESRSRCIG